MEEFNTFFNFIEECNCILCSLSSLGLDTLLPWYLARRYFAGTPIGVSGVKFLVATTVGYTGKVIPGGSSMRSALK
jgi:hypothetical protein